MFIDPRIYGVTRGDRNYCKFLNDFFAEASLLVSLRHVNVIRVYGVVTDAEGIPWMLLELADMPLDQVLRALLVPTPMSVDAPWHSRPRST